MTRSALLVLFLTAAGLPAQTPDSSREWLNRGVEAFKSARYNDAVEAFQKAVDLDPTNVAARLYLATGWMQMYIPGAESPENTRVGDKAEQGFRDVLTQDATNKVALASLASLDLNRKRWDDARSWYQRLLSANPNDAQAYYSLGFIAWSQWYPAYGKARAGLGMKPEDPGPIADPSVRTNLRAEFWSKLDDGLWNLNKALEINPRYDDAMAYMNLLIRERADLRDTREEYTRDIAEADQWMRKVLEIKKQKAQSQVGMGSGGFGAAAPPPPPPPPPPGQRGDAPARLRIPKDAQERMLISQPAPVYPPLALQARVQGTVSLSVVVSREGSVQRIEVVSGHPLLVPAAIEAVKQWRYQPTLLNGNPVEVATTVDVNFAVAQ